MFDDIPEGQALFTRGTWGSYWIIVIPELIEPPLLPIIEELNVMAILLDYETTSIDILLELEETIWVWAVLMISLHKQ